MRNITKLIFAISIASFVAGCATAPVIKTLPPSLSPHIINISDVKYLPLKEMCKTYELQYDWDRIGKTVTIEKADFTMRLLLDSTIAIVNGKTYDINDKVTFYNGQLMIPLTTLRLLPEYVELKRPKPKAERYKVYKVVIDAGHGGRDPGAIGRGGLREKDVTLDLSKRVSNILNEEGIDVVMTRRSDKFVSLWGRTAIANKENADFFISIHANASRSRYAKGFEIYYLSEKMDDTTRALVTAENASLKFEEDAALNTMSDSAQATVWDMIYTENREESIELAKMICRIAYRQLNIRSRGAKGAGFYVLKGVQMPAVLVETGYITNRYEEERLASSSYRQHLAEAIAQGILNYIEEFDVTEGFTR